MVTLDCLFKKALELNTLVFFVIIDRNLWIDSVEEIPVKTGVFFYGEQILQMSEWIILRFLFLPEYQW